nr:hypothetical protein [Tanacetum cinerariifolium]
MIECVIHAVKTDMVIHTAKTEMMRLVVEIEYVDMSADEFDKETGSSDGLQPKQANLNCVHSLNEPHLHEIRVVTKNPSNAIAPVLPTEEPNNCLSMEDEHLSTIPETESDEVIKSSVENLIPIPSEFEDFSDNESECDVPVCNDFMTFSNPLFDSGDDFSSSDDESFSVEDVPKEIFKIYSNPLFDNEIISRVSGELSYINLVPSGINKADFDPEEEICLIEELLYDNSSPRPPIESNSEISNATIESFSRSHILAEDSDFHIEEINLFLAMDDLMPPGIENDDYDSEGDIRFLEEFHSDDPLPFLKMSHLTLIVMMIRHFLVLLRNHRMLSFGVDAAMVIKEKHQVFTAASEDISAARQKLMLLVTAAK